MYSNKNWSNCSINPNLLYFFLLFCKKKKMRLFIFTIVSLVTISALYAQENVIEQVDIDLRTFILHQNQSQRSQLYLYQNPLGDLLSKYDIKMSRLHSSQLDNKLIQSVFKLVNKTSVMVTPGELSREKLCRNIKSCGSSQNEASCVLSLSLILYLSPSLLYRQQHFNQIKLVKLNMIVSSLTEDQLNFERDTYEFSIQSNETLIGSVRASSLTNNDLNGLIKYYIVSNSVSTHFQIDESTGFITMSSTNDEASVIHEFYVEAFMQCSLAGPIKNRTLVRVNLVNQHLARPKLSVTNLIETKQLTATAECLILTKNDLADFNGSIALAQIQVETHGQSPVSSFNLSVDSIRPGQIDVSVKHLIDSIFVLYLTVTKEYRQLFLTDLYQIRLKLSQADYVLEQNLHVCVNTPVHGSLHEELSLVQFSQSVYTIYTAGSGSADLTVLNLDRSNTSLIGFSVDSGNSTAFRLQVQPSRLG